MKTVSTVTGISYFLNVSNVRQWQRRLYLQYLVVAPFAALCGGKGQCEVGIRERICISHTQNQFKICKV